MQELISPALSPLVSHAVEVTRWLTKVAEGSSKKAMLRAYCDAVDGYSRCCDLAHVEMMEMKMNQLNLKRDSEESYRILLTAFSRFDGQTKKCRSLLEQMRADGFKVTKPVLEAFVCGLARGGALAEAETILKNDIPTSSMAARTILRQKTENGLYVEAMEWFEWMKSARVNIDAEAYEGIIAMLGKRAAPSGSFQKQDPHAIESKMLKRSQRRSSSALSLSVRSQSSFSSLSGSFSSYKGSAFRIPISTS